MFLKILLKPFLPKEYKPIWYITVDGKKEGPLSFKDLQSHPKVTPLTLVWKVGYQNWVPLGSVPELSKIFEKRVDDRNKNHPSLKNGPESVLEEGRIGFFPSFWWVILTLVLIAYSLIRFWMLK